MGHTTQTGYNQDTGQTGQTRQRWETGQTDLTLKLDFPGNLCRTSFAIVMMFYQYLSRGSRAFPYANTEYWTILNTADWIGFKLKCNWSENNWNIDPLQQSGLVCEVDMFCPISHGWSSWCRCSWDRPQHLYLWSCRRYKECLTWDSCWCHCRRSRRTWAPRVWVWIANCRMYNTSFRLSTNCTPDLTPHPMWPRLMYPICQINTQLTDAFGKSILLL